MRSTLWKSTSIRRGGFVADDGTCCTARTHTSWYRPWILLGGLQARVRDSFSPATAFGLQYRRRGSCHTPVFTWRPSIPCCRSSNMECATAQCHLCTIFVLILMTPEDISFPATTASITLITVSWSWSALALSTMLILANWTELNWTEHPKFHHWTHSISLCWLQWQKKQITSNLRQYRLVQQKQKADIVCGPAFLFVLQKK